MASSPDYLRLAASSTRALADAALDSLRDAVVVVDARHKQLAVVLANAAARSCLLAPESAGLIELPLHRWLVAASASTLETALATLSDPRSSTIRVLEWRCVEGTVAVNTEIKLLAMGPEQHLVMLTFVPTVPEPSFMAAIDNLPLDLLILDRELKVTYANAGAVRASTSVPGGLRGMSVLRLSPTSALHPDVFTRALQGSPYHDDAVEVATLTRPTRWFEVDVQPLQGASGIVGLVVLSVDVTEHHLAKHSRSSGDRRLLALTEHARDIITVAAADGKVQFVSGGVRNSLGYTSEERESNNLFEHVHPEDHESVRAKYQQLVDGDIGALSALGTRTVPTAGWRRASPSLSPIR